MNENVNFSIYPNRTGKAVFRRPFGTGAEHFYAGFCLYNRMNTAIRADIRGAAAQLIAVLRRNEIIRVKRTEQFTAAKTGIHKR